MSECPASGSGEIRRNCGVRKKGFDEHGLLRPRGVRVR